MSNAGQVTALLQKTRHGDIQAESELMEIIYDELHRLAMHHLRRERPNHTLQPTALVNEVYLQLVEQKDKEWQGRAHFLAVSAQLMRRILVDYARMKRASKRGAGAGHTSLDDALLFSNDDPGAFLDLDLALQRLAAIDPRQSQIVELRFFGGLTEEEIAAFLGLSARTVKREWSMARAWLLKEMESGPEGAPCPRSAGKP